MSERVQFVTARVEMDAELLFFSGILWHRGRTRSLLSAGKSDLEVAFASGAARAETEESRFAFAEDAVRSARHTEIQGVVFRGTPFEGVAES
jgi:hypothetical protein